MATIYEQTFGALYAQPGRTVATFPSGLCRVDQKYVCASVNAATHRATLAIGNDMPDGNDAPAIDGLKIFPSPQEVKRGDGFTDFVVSAYGRASAGVGELTQRQVVLTGTTAYVQAVRCDSWELVGTAVIPTGGRLTLEDITYDEDLLEPIWFNTPTPITRFSNYNGTTYLLYYPSEVVDSIVMSLPRLTVTSQSYFGSFVEIAFTINRALS